VNCGTRSRANTSGRAAFTSNSRNTSQHISIGDFLCKLFRCKAPSRAAPTGFISAIITAAQKRRIAVVVIRTARHSRHVSLCSRDPVATIWKRRNFGRIKRQNPSVLNVIQEFISAWAKRPANVLSAPRPTLCRSEDVVAAEVVCPCNKCLTG
jgi:hypothetical protein